MKKFLSIMAALAMIVSFAACGPTNQNGENNPDEPKKEENTSGLQIEMNSIRYNGCDITVTPNDKKKYYFVEVAQADTLKKYKSLETLAAAHINSLYSVYKYYVDAGYNTDQRFEDIAGLLQGTQELQVTQLEAETEYAILAYYINVDGEIPVLDGTVGKESFKTVKYVDEAPFRFESHTATEETFTFTSIEVQKDKDNNVSYFDMQTAPDAEGMFYECVIYVMNGELAKGTYEITDSGEANTAVASPGAYQGEDGSYLVQPSLVGHTNGSEMDQVWFLRGGNVKIEYPKADHIKITGVVTSFYGTKIAITYNGAYEDPSKDTAMAPALMPSNKVSKKNNATKTYKF